MQRTKELASRLNEVLLEGTWIANTNFREQLENTTWIEATTQIGSLNTIAALTFHVSYYLDGLNNVFQGGDLEIRDKYSFDFAPVTSEEDWNQLRHTFLTVSETFIQEIGKFPDSKLDAPFVEEQYGTYLRNIEGNIEHIYYHLGQISVIKKLISENHHN